MRYLRGWLGVVILTVLVGALIAGASSLARALGGWVWGWWPGDWGLLGGASEHTAVYATTIPVETARKLVLVNITGRVTVEGGSADCVEVSVTKRVRGATAGAERVLAELGTEVERFPGIIRLQTTYPSGKWPSQTSVDYLLRVPASFDVDISNVTGTVFVSGVQGSINVHNVTGSVDVAVGELPALAVNVVTGTIRAAFTPVTAGRYRLNTVTGTIWVEVPADAGLDVALSVVTGRITPGSGPWEVSNVEGRHFEGRAQGGGASLTASTVTGSITLERR